MVQSAYTVEDMGHLCFDATRKFEQYGRYMNHARSPNAVLTPPCKVRGKWRIGFLAVKDIRPSEGDYCIFGEEWSGCKLVDGVVQHSKQMLEREEEERRKVREEDGETAVATTRSAFPHQPRRRLCYCPIEGCTSRPLAKLSNHLAQVHKLNPQERGKYLGFKRKFASPNDIEKKTKKTVLRRSQRTL